MGLYINVGNEGFRVARNSDYVDKSGLIQVVNSTLNTERQFSCVSRARRFGKSMAAKMLCAYYDQSCNSYELFHDLAISADPQFRRHLNHYPVIYLDMTDFVTRYRQDDVVANIQEELLADIRKAYPDVIGSETDDIVAYLNSIVQRSGHEKFIMIIDEWDAILREFAGNADMVDRYIDWLRRLFKSSQAMTIFAGVYMTGILPIKKYKTQSALNNFHEYSMVQPGPLAEYFGFTKSEVESLCQASEMKYSDMAEWYDGYQIGGTKEIFNPTSVMTALYNKYCGSYWANTGAYDVLATYIRMDFDGLRDDVIRLLGGESCAVDTVSFQNDLNVVRSKDDVLTLLIHLGYLSYNREDGTCRIPNREVAQEFKNAIVSETGWNIIAKALKDSDALLAQTLAGDEVAVAAAVDAIHADNSSVLQYNDENSLACVLAIAYYSAKKEYLMIRELPTGKGFADIVLVPRPSVRKPAVVLELKYDKSADAAILQIHDRRYAGVLKDFAGEVLLVGINYDKSSKHHECMIEKLG